MSIIQRLGNDFENLLKILKEFEDDFSNIVKHLKLKGVPLDQALIEQASWVGHYEIRQAELKTIRKVIESRIEKVRGKLWKHYTEKYPRELIYRDKENYINYDELICELRNMFHEVSEQEERYAAACDALKQRGFMLNSLVRAKTGGFDSIIL